ncbi:MAG: M48 family metalloprotease [Alphaproteobacteria bacterium]|jgi:predicted Zn-dependent protease
MITRLRSFFVIGALLTLAGFLAGCSTNPATGESNFSIVSPAQERDIGADAHPQVIEQFGVYEEFPALNAYVAGIALRLHSVSEMASDPFTFTLLDSDMVNAFAIPGGYVYVTRGLMALANNEAELAGVIGHEIGHVTARHGAQRMTQQTLAQLGVIAVGIALQDQNIMQLANAGAMAWLAGYSRSQELQSDELGVRYLSRSGYDPLAMASFLDQLGAQSELSQKLAFQDGAPDPADNWLSTHPRTEDRVVAAAQLARNDLANPFLGRNEYLRQIDGMVYGDSPEQGYRRGNTFSHPELRFTFEVPDGFAMQNSASAVAAFNADGALIIFDGGAYSGGSMTNYTQTWANELVGQQTPLNDLERIDVNGMEAATGWMRLPLQQGQSDVRLLAIRYDSSTVYRFVFIAPSNLAGNLARDFQRTTYSFRKLSSSEANALRPLRIRVVEVRNGDTIDSLSRRMDIAELPRDHFMVLNDIGSNADLQPGMLVKLIQE